MRRLSIASILAFGLTACGTDLGGGKLSQGEAFQAYGAAQAVAGQAIAAGANCTSCLQTSSALELTGFSFDCPSGGSISISGLVTDNSSYDVSLSYNACQSQGFTIGGNIEYEGSVSGQDIMFSMNGNLVFSGTANGSCGINLSVTTSGQSVSFSGNFCGQKLTYNSP